MRLLIKQITLDYPKLATSLRWRGRRFGRNGLKRGLNQFLNGPHAICNPERHSGRHPQGFMRAAEIVERDVQAHSG